MEEKTQVELQLRSTAWIPSTPLKPISPITRLICQRIPEKEVCKDGSPRSGLSEAGFAAAASNGRSGGTGKECISNESAKPAGAAVVGFMGTRDARPDQSPRPRLTTSQPPACGDGVTKSGGYVCDLNKLPGNEEDNKVSSGSTPFFTPITPDKAPPKSGKGDPRNYQDYKGVPKNVLSEEVGDPSKGESQHESSKKTPRQKARRKKHRPKVVKEGKQQRKQRMTMDSTEKPPVKRKYVRRKKIGKSASPGDQMTGLQQWSASPAEKLPIDGEYEQRNGDRKFASGDDQTTGESNDQQNPLKKTCRRALSFDKNEQPGDETAENLSAEKHRDSLPAETSKPISTEHSGEQIGASTESTNVENQSSKEQTLKSIVTRTEGNIQTAIQGNHQPEKPDACFRNEFFRYTHVFVRRPKSNTTFLNSNGLSYSSSINQIDVQFNMSSEAHQAMARAEYPEVPEETGIEKILLESTTGENKTQCDAVVEQSHSFALMSGLVDVPQIMLDSSNKVGETRAEFQGRKQLFGCELQLGRRDWLTKKRSRVPIRARDLSSLNLSILGNGMPDDPSKRNLTGPEAPTTCMEALLADIQGTFPRKKRTKKEHSEIYSANSGNATEDNPNLYGSVQSGESAGNHPSGARPELRKYVLFIDALVKKLEHLDINKESSGNSHGQLALICHDMANQERAIAIYNRDGPIMSVPPKKKRRPRAKVELDDETTRVWKLLLKNIETEGIDGTDYVKERWWEEERRVFKGRADSFIARMHLVQGDRRFSPWKGSVVDSVVGVFLTQNVSDHLSSSAFMSLASRFPSKLNQEECYEEATGPSFYDPNALRHVMTYPRSWTHYMLNQRLSDQNPVMVNENKQNEETEFVYNNAHIGRENCSFSCLSGSQSLLTGLHGSAAETSVYFTSTTSADYLRKDAYYLTEDCFHENGSHSSQGSIVTSPNSEDYISTKNASKMGASLYYNPQAEDFYKGSYFADRPFMENATVMQISQMPNSKTLHGSFVSEVEDELPNQNQECALRTPSDIFYGWPGHKNARTNFPLDHTAGITESTCGISGEDNSLCKSSKNEKPPTFHDYQARNGRSIINKMTTLPYNTLRQSIQYRYPNRDGQEYLSLGSGPNVEPRDFYEELDQVGYNRMWLHSYSEPLLPGKPRNACKTMVPQGIGKDQEEDACWEKQGSSFPNNSPGKNKETPSEAKSRRTGRKFKDDFDWDSLRIQAEIASGKRVKTPNTMDSVNWETVRSADVNAIADAIRDRGMNNVLAERIKDFLNRLVKEHGSIDLEWLRDIQPDEAKEYLLSIRGLGLKSVECVRLLTLHHLAFPVDTNVGRIAVRLGWVPLQPLPESLQLHLLELYPVLESIQKYLWPRLCKLDQRTLYELHYQMITFGKVFCTKSKPNCNACPMRGECRHFASAFASARLALPGPEEKSIVVVRETGMGTGKASPELPLAITSGDEERWAAEIINEVNHCQPIIEEPVSPEPEGEQTTLIDIEDLCFDTSDEMPTIKLDLKEFTENIQNYIHQHMDIQEHDMSNALVALNPEAASIPVPKLKNMSRLRTEHLVYEIPEDHPLMNGLEKLEVDDPSNYLLAIWTPGETATSFQPPERRCNFQEQDIFCNETTCFSCNSVREADAKTIRGTFLIPCRTAMRGSFPLNGTYFQVNEVFADHETSLNPIYVPRNLLWKLQRRTVYFGTSISTIFRGLSTEGIQHCFWKGYVCVRGFDRRLRAPRPLVARLHFPASRIPRTSVKNDKRNLNQS